VNAQVTPVQLGADRQTDKAGPGSR
jgi:hypothetical protein